ncbi:MAG: hypothetical protein JO022_08960, partial [Acidobacteriaceae bacterium]|nr:hypothetical protein [Acidobacteriaceae bacterium]
MSLRTRIRLSIVALVTLVVVGLAALYVYDLTLLAFDDASSRANLVSTQVKDFLLEQLREQTAARKANPVTLADYKALWTDIVRNDQSLPIMLERAVANADVVVRIQISGPDGSTLAASSPYLAGSPVPAKQDFSVVRKRNWFLNLWDLETRPEDYIKTVSIGVAAEPQPLFKITVVIRSTLLRAAMSDAFR